MIRLRTMLAGMLVMLAAGPTTQAKMEMRTFPVLAGAGAHDVYPAPDGAVWFTAQSAGKLGRLDPRTGKSDLIALDCADQFIGGREARLLPLSIGTQKGSRLGIRHQVV